MDSGQMISIMRGEHSKVTVVDAEGISANMSISDAHLFADGGFSVGKPGSTDSCLVVAHRFSSEIGRAHV